MNDRALAQNERTDLGKCERVLEALVRSVFEAGEALRLIRNSRLYRETHSSFDSYVEERWGIPKSSAKRWIQAAEVRKELESAPGKLKILPANEAQTLALTKLPDGTAAEVWGRVVEQSAGEPVTAAAVVAEVEKRLLASAQLGPIDAIDHNESELSNEEQRALRLERRRAFAMREGIALPLEQVPQPEPTPVLQGFINEVFSDTAPVEFVDPGLNAPVAISPNRERPLDEGTCPACDHAGAAYDPIDDLYRCQVEDCGWEWPSAALTADGGHPPVVLPPLPLDPKRGALTQAVEMILAEVRNRVQPWPETVCLWVVASLEHALEEAQAQREAAESQHSADGGQSAEGNGAAPPGVQLKESQKEPGSKRTSRSRELPTFVARRAE